MSRLRSRLTEIADRSGIMRALFVLRGAMRPRWLTIVTWHRVDDLVGAADVDDGVLDATPAEFRAQVEVLAKHFHVVRLDDVKRALDGGPLPANPALLTFDDGYRDGLEHALPILRGAGVPATFFLATSPITHRIPFWWDSIAWIIKHAKRGKASLPPYGLHLDFQRDGKERGLHACLGVVKTRRGLDLEGFLRELAEALDTPWDADTRRSIADRLLMTWDDARALESAGMEIGSHTRTHRVLDTLPESELDSELAGAREDLARELGHAPTALAYPVGKPVSHIPAVRRALERAGYEMAFTYLTGFQGLTGPIDRFALRRIAMDRGTPIDRFQSRLATVGLFG